MARLVALLAAVVLVGVAAAPPAQAAKIRSCGQVKLSNAELAFRVVLSVRGVACSRAKRIAERSLFGQGAAPIGGWRCPKSGSDSGRCQKSSARIYWTQA